MATCHARLYSRWTQDHWHLNNVLHSSSSAMNRNSVKLMMLNICFDNTREALCSGYKMIRVESTILRQNAESLQCSTTAEATWSTILLGYYMSAGAHEIVFTSPVCWPCHIYIRQFFVQRKKRLKVQYILIIWISVCWCLLTHQIMSALLHLRIRFTDSFHAARQKLGVWKHQDKIQIQAFPRSFNKVLKRQTLVSHKQLIAVHFHHVDFRREQSPIVSSKDFDKNILLNASDLF